MFQISEQGNPVFNCPLPPNILFRESATRCNAEGASLSSGGKGFRLGCERYRFVWLNVSYCTALEVQARDYGQLKELIRVFKEPVEKRTAYEV
ncbi:hypothetical protein AVEN_130300-1 [Araneus ventricosus]|uniref:Uncharacterized protein n=1 Tax=Araneus ventricosus TaxID=182803 RepID=A0A4Y2WHN5_ARAVE|nr:hypothetical protein AVEN_60621-1 [Araneus ventricosus]GBO07213.1 hypothetical protein AVEN_123828-1 [Araneus ventricosus]GBO37073.1 hypothetical protein AVEN_6205-1 [Araneus ventricosus]GBO37076.1 hypothetical protein AVEN_130300-1 [Araneus ventricosus]